MVDIPIILGVAVGRGAVWAIFIVAAVTLAMGFPKGRIVTLPFGHLQGIVAQQDGKRPCYRPRGVMENEPEWCAYPRQSQSFDRCVMPSGQPPDLGLWPR